MQAMIKIIVRTAILFLIPDFIVAPFDVNVMIETFGKSLGFTAQAFSSDG